jgi:hypothetical protein
MNEKKDNSGFDAADIPALSHLYRGEVYLHITLRCC